jgi:hypothetical protein
MALNHPSRLWWFSLRVRSILRDIKCWWSHRHETPYQREQRIEENRKKFREIYNSFRAEYDSKPDSKALMEWRDEMDEFMNDVLGKE